MLIPGNASLVGKLKYGLERPDWLGGVLMLALLLPVEAADWPQWRGPSRSGATSDNERPPRELPADGLMPAWLVSLPGGGNGGWGSPVVAEGSVLLTTHVRERKRDVELPAVEFPPLTDEQKASLPLAEQQAYEKKRQDEQRRRREKGFVGRETLLCLDARSGDERWRSELTTRATQFPQSGTPAVVDRRVYHLTADRTLRCLDLEGGRTLWATPLAGPTDDRQTPSSVLVTNGLAIVFAGPLSAVDAASGELRWQNQDLVARDPSPAVWDNEGRTRLVVNTEDGRTHLVAIENGAVVWSVESGASRSTPVVIGDRLITAAQNRKAGIRAWRLSDGGPQELWKYQRIADPGATPAVGNGRVYAVGDKKICCLDLETGEPIFEGRLDIAQPRYTSPIAVGDAVLYTHEGLFVFAGSKEIEPAIAAIIGEGGRIAPEEWFRTRLEVDRTNPRAVAAAWEKAIGRFGPLDCSSPALAGGKLYLRLKQGIACYDFQAAIGKPSSGAE